MNKNTFLRASRIFKILIFSFCFTQAQTNFPYDALPLTDGAFNNTLNMDTSAGVTSFNNLLLGSNVDFNTSVARVQLSFAPLLAPNGTVINANAANQGFNSPQGQQFIADNDPVVLRFPQGVFANTYNWERVLDTDGSELAAADSRHITDPFVIGTRVISQHDSPTSVRIGYPSLRKIFDTAESIGKPLDLLTVLSIINNDADSNGRRWQSMIDDGHNVRDMELGNEFFFRSQRSGTINTEAQWVSRAREVVANIKNRASELDREVRFAIPISFRGGDPAQSESGRATHQRYNDLITVDESFFDAIVVHRYVTPQRSEGNRPEDLTSESLRDLISASRIMDQTLTYCKAQVSENKNSIWLTEWGVAGSEEGAIGASFLGAADIYSHIINNNNRLEVERINWFSTVGANAQYSVNGSRNNVQIETTGYGDVYRLLRDNLKNSELFNGTTLTSPELKLGGNAQEGRPVHVISVKRPGGKPRFIITNKTNANARIFISRDGNNESIVNYIANGVRWGSLTSATTISYSDTQTSVNAIVVPPYSLINVDLSFGEGVSVLSVDDTSVVNKSKSIQLYPNPTSKRFNIALNGFKAANVVIRDVLGKTVYQTKTDKDNLQLDVNGVFKTGVYFVSVLDENRNTYFKKLIIE
jgi:hypothetical protein